MANISEYNKIFEMIVSDILSELDILVKDPETVARVEKILRYNVPHKSELRGFIVPMAYLEIVGSDVSENEKRNAYFLGWSLQLLQSYMGMVDDYFDDGAFRFGRPSWYYINNKSPINVNDALLLSEIAYKIIHKNLCEHPAYVEILRFFSDMKYNYHLGQNLELDDVKNLFVEDKEYFTKERYMLIGKLVVVDGFLFTSQLKLALILAGYGPEGKLWKEVYDISVEISYYWMVLDDYLDSFGKDLINPINNEDIKKGKTTWLIIKAKELSCAEQWKVLMENYGRKDEAKVAIVKEIFQSLGIPDLCQAHLCEVKNRIEEILTQRENDGKKLFATLKFMLKGLTKLDE